jgi:hypothetical protein
MGFNTVSTPEQHSRSPALLAGTTRQIVQPVIARAVNGPTADDESEQDVRLRAGIVPGYLPEPGE